MPLDLVAGPAQVRQPKLTTVQAQLTYLEPPSARPYTYAYDPGPGVALTNTVFAAHPVTIANARPIAEQLSLDVEGVALRRQPTSVTDFDDEAVVNQIGHAEAIRLVQQETGADRVMVFDHTVRRRRPEIPDRTPGAPRQPAIRVHDDYTEASGPQRVRDVLPDEAEALLSRRFAFINVWRPIGHAALEWPLAVCDERSVDPGDLVAMDLIYEDRRGEIYAATFNPNHRWLYVPDMQVDEALLIKCYDSSTEVARFTLHSAFEDPTTLPDAPWRESIEYRTIAFF